MYVKEVDRGMAGREEWVKSLGVVHSVAPLEESLHQRRNFDVIWEDLEWVASHRDRR